MLLFLQLNADSFNPAYLKRELDLVNFDLVS